MTRFFPVVPLPSGLFSASYLLRRDTSRMTSEHFSLLILIGSIDGKRPEIATSSEKRIS